MANNNRVSNDVWNVSGDVPMVISTGDVLTSRPGIVATNATSFLVETIYDGTGRSCLTDIPTTTFQNSTGKMAYGSISGGMVQ